MYPFSTNLCDLPHAGGIWRRRHVDPRAHRGVGRALAHHRRHVGAGPDMGARNPTQPGPAKPDKVPRALAEVV